MAELAEEKVPETPEPIEPTEPTEGGEEKPTPQPEDKSEEKAEVVVVFGDEETAEPQRGEDTPVIREMRIRERKKDQRIRELEKALRGNQQPAPGDPKDPGPKPRLQDFDYETDAWEKKLDEWHEAKSAYASAAEKRKAEQKELETEWQKKIDKYHELKGDIKASAESKNDAEERVTSQLTEQQRHFLIDSLDNPALVVYALGTNPEKLAELSKVKNHSRFIAEVAKLEAKMKIKERKGLAPKPEKIVRGSGSTSSSLDSVLEKLEEEADKTGDRTKVVRFLAEKRKRELQAR